jgi:hypothetical protein
MSLLKLPEDSYYIKRSKDSKDSDAELRLIEDLPSVLGSQSTSTNMLNGMSIKLFIIKPS